MIILQFDPKHVIVQSDIMTPVKFSSASECLTDLVVFPTKEAITVIYPCAGSIPSSSVEPLTRRLVKKLEASLSFLPEWNKLAFEMIEGLLPMVEQQPVQVAFDDYLFVDLPENIRSYALPYDLSQQYPRYGNDGLAHAWAFHQIKEQAKNGPLITVHLQDRPTLAGFLDGKVVDTTTGYSPLDGLPGKTTCGMIDPGLLVMLASSGMTMANIRTELCEHSGWQSVPSPEGMRRNFLVKAIGSMAASCHGLKALFFFGNDLSEVPDICKRYSRFGLRLKESKPQDASTLLCLTSFESKVEVFCLHKEYGALLSEMVRAATHH